MCAFASALLRCSTKRLAIGCDVLNLAGDWNLTSGDGGISATYPVPGDVHSALIAAGAIPHPYVGRNELDIRWVADQEWVATRKFTFSKLPDRTYYLDIDYLDTIAEIYINSELVLKAENSFRRYRPDVGAQLVDGENTIEIVFGSNTLAANAKQAAQPFPVPYSVSNNPIPNGNMLRKPACHFGWDWNLAIVPFGLYGKIGLCSVKSLRIEHIVTQQLHGGPEGAVSVDVDVTLHGRGSAELRVILAGETKTRRVDNLFGEARQRFRFKIENPKLWWPAGHGEQALYDVTVTCGEESVTRTIGLRVVELLTDADDTGSRFAFRVNGREIFCKGANWIPADALPSQATPVLTRKLLKAAVDANMNMIRVWGGGTYEKDFFYEICDELGLMVWQDFMFSCSLYPSTPEFLREVKAEVDYQVRRLQHHACLTLWCGDNELIGALTWFKESKENRDRYLVSYDRLNRHIEETMRLADPNGLWWPSSPSPGVMDFGDAWHDDTKGDMHFWSVWHEGRDFEHYRDVKPRFCSEFGFQSFPSLRIAQGFVEHQDELNISSAVMEHHQRNKGGNARIAETMFRYFRFPMDFGNFVYLSQVQQALAMRTAVDYWRSLKPHCMGALYWQLNDTWPVASWSGLDHGGGWKALHYAARRFNAPVNIVVIPEAGTDILVVTGINDTAQLVQVEVDFFAVAADGAVLRLTRAPAQLPNDRAVEITRIASAKIPPGSVLCWSWHGNAGVAGRNHYSPVPYKSLALLDPQMTWSVTPAGGELLIRIKATKPSFYVSVESTVPGHFSENFFDMLAGETVELRFTPDIAEHVGVASQHIVVRDLYSSSHSRKD